MAKMQRKERIPFTQAMADKLMCHLQNAPKVQGREEQCTKGAGKGRTMHQGCREGKNNAPRVQRREDHPTNLQHCEDCLQTYT